MLFLSLVLSGRVTRIANIVASFFYVVTIAGSAIGESNYYCILGSLVEAALLAGVVYYAWTWPKASDARRQTSHGWTMARRFGQWNPPASLDRVSQP